MSISSAARLLARTLNSYAGGALGGGFVIADQTGKCGVWYSANAQPTLEPGQFQVCVGERYTQRRAQELLDAEALQAPPVGAMLVEYMPMYLRASHEAAGNRGSYPHNGSVRVVATDIDEGEWTSVIRPARLGDVERYGLATDTDTADGLGS